MEKRHFIAKRAAAYFKEGDVVNLGVGVPTLCSNYAPKGVMFETENGVLGVGEAAEGLLKTERFANASAEEFVPVSGASGFDSCMSFGLIRGGRVDATVLGALQVGENGDLANWGLPGRLFGMGGAMDLVNGAKTVIVAIELCDKKGNAKIVKKCTFPLTGLKCVDHIVTEYGVIDVTDEGLVLREVAEGHTAEELQELIEPELIIADDLKEMK